LRGSGGDKMNIKQWYEEKKVLFQFSVIPRLPFARLSIVLFWHGSFLHHEG